MDIVCFDNAAITGRTVCPTSVPGFTSTSLYSTDHILHVEIAAPPNDDDDGGDGGGAHYERHEHGDGQLLHREVLRFRVKPR